MWTAILQRVQDKSMLASWANVAVFQEQTAARFVVGFHPSSAFSRDSLLRDRNKLVIEGLIRELGGKALTLACETRDDLPAPEVVDLEEDEPPEEPAAAPTAGASPESAAADTPPWESPPTQAPPSETSDVEGEGEEQGEVETGVDTDAEVEAAPPMDEEKFNNDLLIQEALQLFEAEVEST